jgi:lipid-A-disaccharide synthase
VAVVGLVEVLGVLPRARRIFHRLLAAVEERRPRTAVLIDSPEFNLRLARELRRRGVPVIYYVSPQVWAWRRGRVKAIARVVDHMLVLFPFEEPFYRAAGVPVTHVGHPLVDEVPVLPSAWEAPPREREPHRLVLLPGSRPSEVEALLPSMLGAVARLAATRAVEARLLRASTVAPRLLERLSADAPFPLRILDGPREERFAAIAGSHLALCASGTATLEVGLLGTPLVVLYRLSPWTYRVARWLVKLPSISLVNLVLQRPAVPELIQERAAVEPVAREIAALLDDRERLAAMRRDLAELRGRLGEPGASRRAAEAVLAVLAAPGGPR